MPQEDAKKAKRNWYFNDGDEDIGPLTKGEMLDRIEAGEIRRSTKVWRKGTDEWVLAGETEFEEEFPTGKQRKTSGGGRGGFPRWLLFTLVGVGTAAVLTVGIVVLSRNSSNGTAGGRGAVSSSKVWTEAELQKEFEDKPPEYIIGKLGKPVYPYLKYQPPRVGPVGSGYERMAAAAAEGPGSPPGWLVIHVRMKTAKGSEIKQAEFWMPGDLMNRVEIRDPDAGTLK